jgi:FixJ family two-component response regulator
MTSESGIQSAHDAAHASERPASPGIASTPAAIVHVVDDDEHGRSALLRLLRAHGFDARGYGSAAEFLVARRDPGHACLLLDVGLPGLSGVDLQAALARAGDTMPVVFLTGRGDIAMSVRAMKAGAVDFLTKPVKRDALFAAIGSALERASALETRNAEARGVRERYARLTAREREVMSLVVRGRLNKQIADALGASVRTIKAHRSQAMKKMEAASVADLVHAAAHLDLASSP